MNESSLVELKGFAFDSGIDYRILIAILNNESNQKGFDEEGMIKSRYESHIHNEFVLVYDGRHSRHKYLSKFDYNWVKKHSLEDLKYLSTSFGMAQIMGYHYEQLLYPTVKGMVEQWKLSELIQVTDFIHFCSVYRNKKFLKALQELDFEKISRYYNGANYRNNSYAKKLKSFFV